MSGSAGWPLNCRAVLRMRASCVCLGRGCLRCGLIWTDKPRRIVAAARDGFGLIFSDCGWKANSCFMSVSANGDVAPAMRVASVDFTRDLLPEDAEVARAGTDELATDPVTAMFAALYRCCFRCQFHFLSCIF
jgi:hypothetical protein